MYSTCNQCGESVGYAEAVGCVTVMIPTYVTILAVGVALPFVLPRLIHSGLVSKSSFWLPGGIAVAVVIAGLVLPLFYWHLPVWLEQLRNRFRKCARCGARDWKVGSRGFGL